VEGPLWVRPSCIRSKVPSENSTNTSRSRKCVKTLDID
jgi:hypothetical protein